MGLADIGVFTNDKLVDLVKNIDTIREERNESSQKALAMNISSIVAIIVVIYFIYANESCKGKVLTAVLLTILSLLLMMQIWCHHQINNWFKPSNYYIMLINDITQLISQINIYSSAVVLGGSALTLFYLYRQSRQF
jgi:hypothetical protein